MFHGSTLSAFGLFEEANKISAYLRNKKKKKKTPVKPQSPSSAESGDETEDDDTEDQAQGTGELHVVFTSLLARGSSLLSFVLFYLCLALNNRPESDNEFSEDDESSEDDADNDWGRRKKKKKVLACLNYLLFPPSILGALFTAHLLIRLVWLTDAFGPNSKKRTTQGCLNSSKRIKSLAD